MINLFLQEMLIDYKHWAASLSPTEVKLIAKVVVMVGVVIAKLIGTLFVETGRKRRR